MRIKENVQRPTPNAQRATENEVRELFDNNVVPSYARFDLVLSAGREVTFGMLTGGVISILAAGSRFARWATPTRRSRKALNEQSGSSSTFPISIIPSRRAAGQTIVDLMRPGGCFFCNSGAEANEGLFKLARKFGHDPGRYEIITAHDSFHGRTLAGIAATGQEKVKKGFEPVVAGFKQVPFNDLEAMRAAITEIDRRDFDRTDPGRERGHDRDAGVFARASRKLCDEHNLLLLFDEVQAGHFRTGKFQSWQRILEKSGRRGRSPFLPDGISMAKSLGGGFPIGAFWVREKFADVLSPARTPAPSAERRWPARWR